MGRPVCFLDFDGTLVDNKRRMYEFCCDYCHSDFRGLITIEDYWVLKRHGINEMKALAGIVGSFGDEDAYSNAKLKHMEDDRYLLFDTLLPHSFEALENLKKRYCVKLVSRREREKSLLEEIDRLGIRTYLDDVLVVPHDGTSKAESIQAKYVVTDEDIIIGDTEDDIQAGLQLGIKTVFVYSGVRSRAYGTKYLGEGNLEISKCLYDYSRLCEVNLGKGKIT